MGADALQRTEMTVAGVPTVTRPAESQAAELS